MSIPESSRIEPDRDGPLGLDPLARSPVEELAHAVTHGVGLLLSIAGAAALMFRVLAEGNIWRVTGCSIFAAALIAVYAASTLSHSIARPPLKRLFRVLDQGFIYLLIVGTFTPLALEYLRGSWWWLLLVCMWIVALVGFVSKIRFSHRIDAVTIWSYLLLGWLPILPARAYLELVPAAALWWILAGGLCYTFGTVFLVLDIRRLHFHAIWHLSVLAGSICHYVAIFLFVACAPPLVP
ncbi:MAG: hemolysin III family protein [Verrucomicrobiales bacterium]|nr:hemolysin III family protein [Verrucomicrobiales bacterium]